MNPWNGEIYALASYPGIDQRRAAVNRSYMSSLFHTPGSPLLDRATSH